MDDNYRSVLLAFEDHRQADPDAVSVEYFGRSLSRLELGELSDAMASHLADVGVGLGDRVAVSLQNTPVFAITLLATWKRGAVLVPVNPMLRSKELTSLLGDCQPKVMVAHPEMAKIVLASAAELETPPALWWSAPDDLAGDIPGPWSGVTVGRPADGTYVLPGLLAATADPPLSHEPAPDELALLVYTSGTTGPSKGAMISHSNVGYQAEVAAGWLGVGPSDSVLTIAPFFHITGMGLHLAAGLGRGVPLVMTYRFDPAHVSTLVRRYAPTFTVGTITAYIALAEYASGNDKASTALRRIVSPISGGAAVPAAVVARYEHEFGRYIRNGYGLTETTSVCIAVPRDERAPVDSASGATSIGRPLPGVTVAIVTDAGEEASAGQSGEIVIRGPQVARGYWNQPEESARTFRADGVHTGDVGMVDANGWTYIIDRIKDLIVVSGYKVWPRDVEDALYRHPAVAEAAVIGVPDEYRGESVRAYVVLRAGVRASKEDLDRHCRELLAAYKCPRQYEIVETLPKSASGKVLRRILRDDT